MALTIQVSKVSVLQQMNRLWNITLKLRCLDGTEEVVNRDFSVRYRPTQSISDKTAELRQQMQKVIDDYKGEQQIFNHSQLNTAVTNIQSNLIG